MRLAMAAVVVIGCVPPGSLRATVPTQTGEETGEDIGEDTGERIGEDTGEDVSATKDTAPDTRLQRFLAVSAVATGVIGLGFGVGFGIDAYSKAQEARRLGCNDDLSKCPSDGFYAADIAYSHGTLSTYATIGGSVAISAGVLLWLHLRAEERKRSWDVSPAVGADAAGAVIRGGF